MPTDILFIHSAGPQTGNFGSVRLLKHLRQDLGPAFRVQAPEMPMPEKPSYAGWRDKLAELLSADAPPRILVGHSLGGSVLLKCLSEQVFAQPPAALFLVATPYWKMEEFALRPDFAQSLPKGLQITLYQSFDDEELNASHLARYSEALPQAQAWALGRGGHTFQDGLQELAREIQAFAGGQ